MHSNLFIWSRGVSQYLILQVMEPLSASYADAAEFWLNHPEYSGSNPAQLALCGPGGILNLSRMLSLFFFFF